MKDMSELEEARKRQQLADLSGDAKYMKKGEFKEYSSNLRAQTSDYRTMKKELEDLRSETVVLRRAQPEASRRRQDPAGHAPTDRYSSARAQRPHH